MNTLNQTGLGLKTWLLLIAAGTVLGTVVAAAAAALGYDMNGAFVSAGVVASGWMLFRQD